MSMPTLTADLPARTRDEKQTKRRLPLLPVQALLEKQRSLTAVERFAKLHESPAEPLHAKFYRDLIPLEKPKPGEQYSFEVDLDACTGCKACVVACHNLNGLDKDELWRTVGLVHGGTSKAPVQQTITSSCHHCVEPACMLGCPTKAYEKDPVTGIVKHLDDQCFGCQYCTLMCPYDAPKYNAELGIVRKCDMCSDRLAHGEAPACVQACPNGAIAIRIIDQESVIASSDVGMFVPGAPDPEHTLPTTQYKTARALPHNLRPADFYHTRPEHSHPPLVIMLTLTQLSVGAFAVAYLSDRIAGASVGSPLAQALFACAWALVALGASVFHLGRPLLFWRAALGLRTSWLSREALVFGLFAQLAIGYGALVAAPYLPDFAYKELLLSTAPALRLGAVLSGLFGVFCSVMVYVVTRREQWSFAQTGVKFFSTTLLLGAASVLVVSSFGGADLMASPLLTTIVATSALKLLFEGQLLTQANDRRATATKRMAVVMLNELRNVTVLRFALLVLGGIALPLGIAAGLLPSLFASVLACALLAGELAERYLFFRAAPASRMPGGLR
ncbi:MAG TPA: DmsC/YnfH family molybdoenzyme membrane anchor subunit [Polyangiales bacterium]|nr:DmsC/YnfH family molybdoenzyme membrane anchor subunit [Polyangiales bacterium]